MKIFKTLKVLALATVLFGANGCDEAFKEPFDIENGGQLGANMAPPASVAYLKGETSSVSFNIGLVENAGIAVSDLMANIVLTTGAGVSGVYSVAIPASGDLNISAADLLQNTPVAGTVLTEATLNAGDSWKMSYLINMADGRQLTAASATTVTFTCPSALAGMYNNFTSATHDFGSSDYNTVEELKDLGAGDYEIPDMTGGVWSLDPYLAAYGTSARVTTLTEVCGNITIADAPDQFGGFITTAGLTPPSYTDGTGVIQWTWVDTIYGETGTTTYTPQ